MKPMNFKKMALALSVAMLPCAALAEIAADIEHPLWYKAPSEKTMELAKVDDLTGMVVSAKSVNGRSGISLAARCCTMPSEPFP